MKTGMMYENLSMANPLPHIYNMTLQGCLIAPYNCKMPKSYAYYPFGLNPVCPVFSSYKVFCLFFGRVQLEPFRRNHDNMHLISFNYVETAAN